ncbi:MAG TPA: hypothetical protein VKQ34_05115 [Candidatus Saccharimonadales bacterium]|nr:hypothetical protein [Candidatus Saccharimonadales bacterium]
MNPEATQAVRVEAAFPRTVEYQAQDFAKKYVDGALNVDIVSDAWSDVQMGRPGFVVYFPVAESTFHQAAVAGQVDEGVFGSEGKVMHTEPGAEKLAALVAPDDKRTSIERYYEKQPRTAGRVYIDDIDGIEYPEALEEISQGYELTDGDRSVRLLNFSPTRLSDEQLRQAVNAVRAASDRTGGAVLEKLYTIAILPKDHPSLQMKVRQADGTTSLVRRGGYQAPHLLALTEDLLLPADQQPGPSAESTKYFDSQRLPDEPIEGPGSPKKTVSSGRWEGTLAHELTHIALDEEQYTANVPGPAPTLYGRSKTIEHVAELGAAQHMGGEDASAVPPDQRQALDQLWQQKRGSDDGVTFRQPQGPHFIRCRELDLTQGPLPLRLRDPGRPLPTEVTYRLNNDTPVQQV